MKNYFTLFSLLFLGIVSKVEAKFFVHLYEDNYVMNKEHFQYGFIQRLNETTLAQMMPCPVSQVYDLGPGECGVVVPSFGFAFPQLVPPPSNVTINQNANTVTVNSTTYCAFGQTSYRKTLMYNGQTDLLVTSVNLGVYESFNSPLVRFDFKTLNGESLGSYLATIPNMNLQVHTVSIPASAGIKIPAQSSFVMEVVANAPFISRFKIGMNNAGYVPGATSTQTNSSCLSLNQEIDPNAGSITPNAVLFNVSGRPDDYKFVNILNDYEEGDYFGIGSHPLTYRVTDAFGNSTNCAFSITVNEFQSTSNSMACDDLVQVSLEEDCELVITPDMLLEGDHYGCYDNFTVQIIDNNGRNLGNTVGRNQIGKTLQTQVFNDQGNSCWGQIYVLDKQGPLLECGNVYANCGSDIEPGSVLNDRVAVAAVISDGRLAAGTPNSKTFNIPVGPFQNTTITDLNVFLEIEHSNISQLAANITGPGGVTVPLFITGGCSGVNMQATFDDAAASPIICEPSITPSVAGKFTPFNSLAVFNGLPLEGNWQVTVYDLSGVGGVVHKVHLIFGQEGAVVPFPTNSEMTAVLIDDRTYRVTGVDACTESTIMYTDEVVEDDCASIYSKVIKRCWTGIDPAGNLSVPCCQYIYIYRNSLSTLTFPLNFDGLPGNEAPLSCKDYGYEIPSTSVTGMPNGDSCDNIQLTEPEDAIIDICAGSYKIFRTHRVIEWCSGSVLIHNQVIKIEDSEGPELECPDHVTISADNDVCSGSLFVARPDVVSECSPVELLKYHLSYSFDGEEFEDDLVIQNTAYVTGLRIGDNILKWTVTDDCGNTSECTFTVTVDDDVRPVAVCDQFTKVAIGGNGIARVDAFTFDDGSHDNCGIVKYEARKMVDVCNRDTLFGEYVEFCCEEVNTSVMVELRVTDIYGRTNTCMVEVNLEDKLPPFITQCPADITLDCQADYTDLTVTGEPVAVDNCSIEDVRFEDVVDISQCGTGTVTRTWTVFDKQGFKHSCVQVITLYDSDPFYYNVDNPLDRRNDIVWPKNYETNVCHSSLDPDNLPDGFDRPSVNDDNCSLVAMHYKDQVFKFVDGACEKIIRTWTVIDWCTYNDTRPVYGQGWYEYTQIIKLQNDIKPDFGFNCVHRTVQGFGDACTGLVDFTMQATDDCPENNTNINWTYELYREDGTTLIDRKNTNRFNHTLLAGVYKVRWIAEDKCGNQAICYHDLTVLERKKPTPYCITSLTTAVMNSDGTAVIWAKDFDRGATDNCTPQNELKFTFFGAEPVDSLLNREHYFKGNGILATRQEYLDGDAQIWIPSSLSSGILFSCDDIPNGISHEVSVDVSVIDLAGNQDFCTVQLILQDNANVCPDNAGNDIVVSGRIVGGGAGVEVILEGESTEQTQYYTTNSFGNYVFGQLQKGTDYRVRAENNKDLLNGVSTLDLVLIQRHLLGISSLNHATDVIAADVDNNQRVSASDLTALRRAILGITDEFPNGQTSWRFVASDFVFDNPQQPFPFKENFEFDDLAKSQTDRNFNAVKIGDVNNTATVNTGGEILESRLGAGFAVATDRIQAKEGDYVDIPVYAAKNQTIFGFQWTFAFDEDVWEFQNVESGLLQISEDNLGFQKLHKGQLPALWYSENPVSMDKDDILFVLRFKALRNSGQTQAVQLSSQITNALAVNSEQKEIPVEMVMRNAHDTQGTFVVHQNQPNPFHTVTVIPFELPESSWVTVTIMDVTGRVVYTSESFYEKGYHTVSWEAETVHSSGVFMYRIDTGEISDTKKMILLK